LRTRKPDGELATNDAENLEILEPFYYKELYNRPSSFDPALIDELPTRDSIEAPDEFPSDEAIKKGIQKLKSGKSGGDGLPAAAWKLMATSKEGSLSQGAPPRPLGLSRGWHRQNGPRSSSPSCRRRATLSEPGNTRGIALMEAVPKLAGIIDPGMLNKYIILPGSDYAYQCGFVPERGCPDGQMPVKLGLTKRHQANFDSYVLFVDLVKAFDSVDRIALGAVLEKSGVPLKLRKVIMALHSYKESELPQYLANSSSSSSRPAVGSFTC
jgi:hypothetical protein